MTIHTMELLMAGFVGAGIGTIIMMVNYGAVGRLFNRGDK